MSTNLMVKRTYHEEPKYIQKNLVESVDRYFHINIRILASDSAPARLEGSKGGRAPEQSCSKSPWSDKLLMYSNLLWSDKMLM